MSNYFTIIFLSMLLTSACNSGRLTVVADLPSSLKEISAIEQTETSNLFWVIEDSGNNNHLYGLNKKGNIVKDITIKNSKNEDWEDLTSDDNGAIYIGDFGNNSKKRKHFTIYKVKQPERKKTAATAEPIHFKLPKGMNSEDFESFFLYNSHFYMFSKTDKKCKIFKVPNQIGDHVAEFISEFKLKGKHTKVTSADISVDGKTVVLLNHNKLWRLTNFTSEDFFSGTVDAFPFDHDSQKEGVYFKSSTTIFITDERTKHKGGNLYEFSLY